MRLSGLFALLLSVVFVFFWGCSDDTKSPCEPGTKGCSCLTGGDPCLGVALMCNNGRCVSCELGSQGCGCGEGGECETPGVSCRDGRCVSEFEVPVEPKCYTPCTQGMERDGEYVPCSAEGLMEGCLGVAECVEGSCVAAGGEPRDCANDSGCPDFQTCILGRCYSNCEGDSDCPGGWGCYRHACRVRCSTGGSPCEGGDRVCLPYDGENGYCMPAEPPEEVVQTGVEGSYVVSPDTFAFSNVSTSARVKLVNESPAPQDFVIHRVSHVEYTDTGRVEVSDQDGTPLHWVELDGCTKVEANGDCSVRVDANGEVELSIKEAANPVLSRWDGKMEVRSERLGKRELFLSYASRPEGSWSGKMYYFASFQDVGLEAWIADPGLIGGVENAFVRRWAEFKEGGITLDEFEAVLTSTAAESWKWPRMNEEWPCSQEHVACYPYDNSQGFKEYSSNLREYPIPTGVVELPVSMNLRQPDPEGSPGVMEGRIVTDDTLHYVGDRAVRIDLDGDPAGCTANAKGVVLCSVEDFQADVLVGGRYRLTGEEGEEAECDAYGGGHYSVAKTPWLVPGFTKGTALDGGMRYQVECRDGLMPYGGTADPALNQGVSMSNPIPDGRTRARLISLVDGALVNGEDLLILFREHFESFMGAGDAEGFSAYGIMRLSRATVDLEEGDYEGSGVIEDRVFDQDKLRVGCSQDLVDEINGLLGQNYSPENEQHLADLASTLVMGGPEALGVLPLGDGDAEEVHFLCADTGLIDNLPDATVNGGNPVPCPEGSQVRYFTLTPKTGTAPIEDALGSLECTKGLVIDPEIGYERDWGTDEEKFGEDNYDHALDTYHETVAVDVEIPAPCWSDIEAWMQNGDTFEYKYPEGTVNTYELRMDPVWRCQDSSKLYCDDDRLDPRQGKDFYPEGAGGGAVAPVFLSVAGAVQDAFRYKTRFRSRTGKNVGFAPEICQQDSMAIPYCYDPEAIEGIGERVDCALYLYGRHCTDPVAQPNGCDLLREFLELDFSYREEDTDGDGLYDRVIEGFERLYAELLIMHGDDAYAQAAASRFDLAGSALRSFEGELFEPPDGINLSGGAGFEMVSLYQAVQYYQMVLDRFYALSPTIWGFLNGLGQMEVNFITNKTVTAYFDRLVRASSQKSRVWSEVAKRYLKFNRPDLARRVVQRAYTSAYLESVVLSRMMLRLRRGVTAANWYEISRYVELAQLGYRAALLDMRQVYDTLTDEVNVFGYPPEYIPFPALDSGDENAFEKILQTAKEKLSVAASKEAAALSASRSYEVDAASFQSEMVSIRQNYEDQLADLCGTFVGDDGRVYPAIEKYAEMSASLPQYGDICGAVGTGRIYEAYVQTHVTLLNVQKARDSLGDKAMEIQYEQEAVQRECEMIGEDAEYIFDSQKEIDAYRAGIRAAEDFKEMTYRIANQVLAAAGQKCKTSDCLPGPDMAMCIADCLVSLAAMGRIIGQSIIVDSIILGCDATIEGLEAKVDSLERDLGRWKTLRPCDYALARSDARVKVLLLDLDNLQIDILRQLDNYKLALSRVQSLYNEARRLQDEQSESEQLAINVAAARNDPNVRIYKNDAILTADRTFYDAVQEAYKATKVYEYYTSQSYAPLIDLFLVRMVAHGDITLESYLRELENNFFIFEDLYGNPDMRVEVLSLRDDIMGIPRYGEGGEALSDGERTRLMRARLADVGLLDEYGYLTVPFGTRVADLCPLTRNHKVHHIEAQLFGSDLGDAVARVYVRQRGTGTVRGVEGDKIYYRFPERTAVVDAVVGEQRVFGDEVYGTQRLRDRPMVNSHWELVVNQKDERVNQDVNLQSLDDVYLYVYYTDFTQL